MDDTVEVGGAAKLSISAAFVLIDGSKVCGYTSAAEGLCRVFVDGISFCWEL